MASKGQEEYSQVFVEHMISRYQTWKTCQEYGRPFPRSIVPLNLKPKKRRNASRYPRVKRPFKLSNGFSYKKNLELSSGAMPVRLGDLAPPKEDNDTKR